MKKSADYFSNHQRTGKFPFSLYHKPLAGSLIRFLQGIQATRKEARVLVIGGGLMHELAEIPPGIRLTVTDIDPRIIAGLKQINHPGLEGSILLKDDLMPLRALEKFDAVYAKEVIEHIIPWQAWLQDIRSLLVPEGRIWLSTPNYGEPWLPLIESTFLEFIAYRSGYSRKNIHPSKFSAGTLRAGLQQAGFDDVQVEVASLRLALIAMAGR